jgi:hypothetical protein
MGGVFEGEVVWSNPEGTDFHIHVAYPLIGYKYPKNSQGDRVQVIVQLVSIGDKVAVMNLPNQQPSEWITEHVNNCAICKAIESAHGANALP